MKITKTQKGVEIYIRDDSVFDEDLDSIEINYLTIDNQDEINFDPSGDSMIISVNRKPIQQREKVANQGSMLKDYLKSK